MPKFSLLVDFLVFSKDRNLKYSYLRVAQALFCWKDVEKKVLFFPKFFFFLLNERHRKFVLSEAIKQNAKGKNHNLIARQTHLFRSFPFSYLVISFYLFFPTHTHTHACTYTPTHQHTHLHINTHTQTPSHKLTLGAKIRCVYL